MPSLETHQFDHFRTKVLSFTCKATDLLSPSAFVSWYYPGQDLSIMFLRSRLGGPFWPPFLRCRLFRRPTLTSILALLRCKLTSTEALLEAQTALQLIHSQTTIWRERMHIVQCALPPQIGQDAKCSIILLIIFSCPQICIMKSEKRKLLHLLLYSNLAHLEMHQ